MSFAGTLQTDLLKALGQWVSRKRAENVAPMLVTDRFAAKIPMPQNKGDTLRLLRHLNYPIIKEKLAIGEQPTTPTRKHKSTYVEIQLQTTGDWIEIPTPEVDKVVIFNAVKEVKDKQNPQIQGPMDWWNLEVLSRDLMPYRPDGNPDYQKSGTCTSSGTTTTFVCTGLTEGDGFWNGSRIIFMAQTPNVGQVRQLDASGGWTQGTNTGTWANDDARVLPAATSTSDTFIIVIGTGIDSLKALDTAGILAAHLRMVVNEVEPYQLITKGKNTAPHFVWMLDPFVEHDLWDDDTFKKHCLSPKGEDVYTSGAFSRFAGFDFCRTTRGYREDEDGAETDTGPVHVSHVLAKNGLLCTRLAGYGKSPDGIVSEIKPNFDPITRFHSLSWSAYRGAMVPFGRAGLGVRTGSSSVNRI